MDEESIGKEALHSIYPAKGPVTEQQVEEDLEQGKIYRLNDRFFKFLFGREDRKPLFLDLVNAFVFPDGSAGFTDLKYANRELSAVRVEGKNCHRREIGRASCRERV